MGQERTAEENLLVVKEQREKDQRLKAEAQRLKQLEKLENVQR